MGGRDTGVSFCWLVFVELFEREAKKGTNHLWCPPF